MACAFKSARLFVGEEGASDLKVADVFSHLKEMCGDCEKILPVSGSV